MENGVEGSVVNDVLAEFFEGGVGEVGEAEDEDADHEEAQAEGELAADLGTVEEGEEGGDDEGYVQQDG